MNKTKSSEKSIEKNPATEIKDFSAFALTIINEIDFARMHPQEFLQKLEKIQKLINESDSEDQNTLLIKSVPFTYNDLSLNLQNAIEFLKEQKPIEGLTYNESISNGCNDLLNVLMMHDGFNENELNNPRYSLLNRMHSNGTPFGEIYELIDYGMFDPEFIVINFILGDDDDNKIDRSIIFNPNLKTVGIASGILPSDKVCTVIDFAEDYFSPDETISFDIQLKYKNRVGEKLYDTRTFTRDSGKNFNKDTSQISLEKKNNNEKKIYLGNLFSMKRHQYMDHNKGNYGKNGIDMGNLKMMNLNENEVEIEYDNENENEDNYDNENEVQIENDNYNNYNDGDEKVVEIERDENDDSENYKDWPDGAIKMNRSEKLVVENGKEMIVVKTIYFFADGHTESVIEKEKVE